jgi:hypothetical protein
VAAGLAAWQYAAREPAAESSSEPGTAGRTPEFVDHEGWMLFPADKERVGVLPVGDSATSEP